MTSEVRFIKVGPADRDDETSNTKCFDLKGHNQISHIFISVEGEEGIMSIQFQYIENGKYVLSDQYGSKYRTSEFYTIDLNHPTEYVTRVSGLYSTSSDNIKVITFTTNIQQYGPYGVTDPHLWSKFDKPIPFTYNLGKSCQFGGFHGSYNSSGFSSIGFYILAESVPPNSGSKIQRKKLKKIAYDRRNKSLS